MPGVSLRGAILMGIGAEGVAATAAESGASAIPVGVTPLGVGTEDVAGAVTVKVGPVGVEAVEIMATVIAGIGGASSAKVTAVGLGAEHVVGAITVDAVAVDTGAVPVMAVGTDPTDGVTTAGTADMDGAIVAPCSGIGKHTTKVTDSLLSPGRHAMDSNRRTASVQGRQTVATKAFPSSFEGTN